MSKRESIHKNLDHLLGKEVTACIDWHSGETIKTEIFKDPDYGYVTKCGWVVISAMEI